MGDAHQKSVDALLTKFGESLKCSEEFRNEGNKLAHAVFKKLKQKSKNSVHQVKFGGRFGKKTDVIESDLDLVVVCNLVNPPLADVLDEFEEVLILYADELRIVPKPGRSEDDSFTKTERSLNFSFKNGIEVDLLPAATIRDEMEIWRKLKDDRMNAYYYNPSFIDKQVSLLTSQDGFTNTLVRLAKYWFKNLYFGEKVNGASAIMELISIAAAEKERDKQDEQSMLRAFAEVLDTIIKVDSLKLAFQELAPGKWKRIPQEKLHARRQDLVPRVVGNKDTLAKSYFIADPANPFQDFLEQERSVIVKMKEFATVTRKVLGDLMDRKKFGFEFIKTLFQPQPEALINEASLQLPSNICVDYSYPYSSFNCDMKVRNEQIMQDGRKRAAIEVIKQRLLFEVNAIVKGDPVVLNVKEPNSINMGKPATLADVQEAAENLICKTFKTSPGLGDKSHEDMDVTLYIPYQLNGKWYAVRFSMIWK